MSHLKVNLHIRLPQWTTWDLRSSGILRSV